MHVTRRTRVAFSRTYVMRAHDMQIYKYNEHTQMIMQDYTMMMKSTSLLHACVHRTVCVHRYNWLHALCLGLNCTYGGLLLLHVTSWLLHMCMRAMCSHASHGMCACDYDRISQTCMHTCMHGTTCIVRHTATCMWTCWHVRVHVHAVPTCMLHEWMGKNEQMIMLWCPPTIRCAHTNRDFTLLHLVIVFID